MKKRIAIFGGNGRIGKQIAKMAIKKGYEVTCIGRSVSIENIPNEALALQGDVNDEDVIAEAIKNVDVVILALSIARNSKSPFARITGPLDLHSNSMKILLKNLNKSKTKRIIKISAQGVGNSKNRTGILFRILIKISNLRFAFNDHEKADLMLKDTDLDWTIIRPPILKDQFRGKKIIGDESLITRSNTTISRPDLAKWIVEIIDEPRFYRRCVTVSEE
jgi:putative NADH-flavin reductase